MNTTELVPVYDSQTQRYHEAFQVFLNHTDQKSRAQGWLNQLVGRLPQRRLFMDIGAGNGKMTAWFTDAFARTIAIEPNDSLRAELKANCPQIEILQDKVLEAKLPASGDLVLCSHVLYYIPGDEWMPTLSQLASWLSDEGSLVVILQNHQTDCMRMLQHFFGRSFDLPALAHQFRSKNGNDFEVTIETVRANVQTADLDSANTIAEFMLNLLPMNNPPAQSEMENYVRSKFAQPGGGFRFSCDQDFLQIRRKKRG